jgi:hypothetical protein
MKHFNFPIEQLERRRKVDPKSVEDLFSIGKVVGDYLTVDGVAYANLMNRGKPVVKFAKSMVTWAGNGFKKVQQHVYEKRLAICRKCQFWQENGNMGMGKCLKCGCGKGKHWLPHEQCPIGLWGKENT